MIDTKVLFARRPFTGKEKATMVELYAFGEMFANRILATLPNNEYTDAAIFRIKNALQECETAVALNPICDRQTDFSFTIPISVPPSDCAREMTPHERDIAIKKVVEEAHHEISTLAAHARR